MADKVALLRDGRIVQTGTPVELYRKPRSRFVAEFLGETNLIRTQASGTGAETSLSIEAGTFRAHLDEEHTGECLVSIRPEAITLKEPGTGGTLPGKLLHSTYLGETAQHLIELKGAPDIKVAQLNPFAPTTIAPSPGDEVALYLSPTDVVPIDHD